MTFLRDNACEIGGTGQSDNFHFRFRGSRREHAPASKEYAYDDHLANAVVLMQVRYGRDGKFEHLVRNVVWSRTHQIAPRWPNDAAGRCPLRRRALRCHFTPMILDSRWVIAPWHCGLQMRGQYPIHAIFESIMVRYKRRGRRGLSGALRGIRSQIHISQFWNFSV